MKRLLFLLNLALGGYALLTLWQTQQAHEHGFDHDLLVQRFFMQVAKIISDPVACAEHIERRRRGWDGQRRIELQLPQLDSSGLSTIQISLISANRLSMNVDGVQRDIPLSVNSCGLDRGRARLGLAGYIALDGGRKPTPSASLLTRCAFGEYLARRAQPLQFACLKYPPR